MKDSLWMKAYLIELELNDSSCKLLEPMLNSFTGKPSLQLNTKDKNEKRVAPMRLFKYLVLSDDLIDKTAGYVINSMHRVNKEKERKFRPIYPEDLASYHNSLLTEVFYLKTESVDNTQTVSHNVASKIQGSYLAVPEKHFDKIKPEYVKTLTPIIRNDPDIRLEPYFKEEYQPNYKEYLVRKKICLTNRNRYARTNNRFYLLKPYLDKPSIALMRFTYSNTSNKSFKNSNHAYVIIDDTKIRELLELKLGLDFKHDEETAKGYRQAFDFSKCAFASQCTKNESCKDIGSATFLGGTWSTENSSKGMKRMEKDKLTLQHSISNKKECHDYLNQEQPNWTKAQSGGKVLATNSDGIITTKAKFFDSSKDEVVMNLHQWLKCKSVSGKKANCSPSELIHLGHNFDNRVNRLKRIRIGEIGEHLKQQRVKGIYRSEYVTVGISYFSTTLTCNCTAAKGNECRYCEGVLYIDTKQGLRELYDQLISEDYLK